MLYISNNNQCVPADKKTQNKQEKKKDKAEA